LPPNVNPYNSLRKVTSGLIVTQESVSVPLSSLSAH
jgi:hypothetical protein